MLIVVAVWYSYEDHSREPGATITYGRVSEARGRVQVQLVPGHV